MSLVYPIARGMAPVIVLIVSVVVLGVATSPAQAAGVALVGVGVILVRGLRGGARWSDVAMALAVATSIAGYTLVDKEGVRYADPVTYVTLILVAPAIASLLFVASRGGTQRLRDSFGGLTIARRRGQHPRLRAGARGLDHGPGSERRRGARGERRHRDVASALSCSRSVSASADSQAR